MFKHHFKALLVGAFLFLGTPPVFSQQAFEGTVVFTFPGWGDYNPPRSFYVTEMTFEQLCAFAPGIFWGPTTGAGPSTVINFFGGYTALSDFLIESDPFSPGLSPVHSHLDGWNGSGATYNDTSGYCEYAGLYLQTHATQGVILEQARSNQQIPYIVFEYTIPPPDPCLDNFTEQCCIEQASNACFSLGGVASYSFLDETMLGGPSCDFVCVDDIEPEDPLPEPPLYTDLSVIEQYLYYILSNQWPTTNAIVGAINDLEINVDFPETDLTEVLELLEEIANASGVDFSDLELMLQAYFDGSVTLDDFMSGIGDVVDAIDNIDFSIGDVDFDSSGIESQLGGISSQLDDFFGSADDYPDFDDYDWTVEFEGLNSDGTISDVGYWTGLVNSFLESFGLDPDPSLDSLELDVINLDDEVDDFNYNFGVSSSCPAPSSINILGRDVSVDWTPFCDIFTVLGSLVIILAYFLFPFIVFGVPFRGGR